jgi:hypothetical protein
MRIVQVYIEGQRLDLFNDETISVTSTQQNVQDISKVFTDFSQSFSVPATPNNNQIFQHFYQNDVNSTLDYNIRRDANIEIDLTPFRRGKISLEKAEVKNNKAYSYQITFYGDVLSLKDKFGDEMLSDVTELDIYNHAYDATEVKNRITNGAFNYGVRYPLIFDRDITYGNGGSTDINYSTGTGAVHYDELFPAIQILAVFNALQTRYDITFSGTFFSDPRFNKAFLLCQNSNSFKFLTAPEVLDITAINYATGENTNPASTYFSIADDTLTYGFESPADMFPGATAGGFTILDIFHRVSINVTSASTSDTYYIDVFQNNQLVQTLEGSGTGEIPVALDNNTEILNKQLKFNVKADDAINLDFTINYTQEAVLYIGPGVSATIPNIYTATANNIALTAEMNVINYVPKMKVADFFAGILKMFNLTCYGTEADKFQIEPLADWYNKGAVIDITEYTDIESININRVKLFKNISFEYEESDSATNTIFKDLTSRGYGNTRQAFNYDGGEFSVKLPFENLMMQKFQGTNLQIGEALNADGNQYTPKPVILYQYDNLDTSFRFTDNTTPEEITTYVPFGQDLLYQNVNYTLNFNADISTLLDAIVPNTLYSVYYEPYLSNLFNLKNRETSVKTYLPISLLTNLKLNDRLVIRDKRYTINDMKSNLTTGQVDFVLLNDFTEVIGEGGGKPPVPIQPSDQAQCIDVRILFPNGANNATITTTDPGVTITPSTLSTDGSVEVCIPANPNTLDLLVTEDNANYINSEDFIRLRTEQGDVEIYTITVTYDYPDGTQVANQIFIQQQP